MPERRFRRVFHVQGRKSQTEPEEGLMATLSLAIANQSRSWAESHPSIPRSSFFTILFPPLLSPFSFLLLSPFPNPQLRRVSFLRCFISFQRSILRHSSGRFRYQRPLLPKLKIGHLPSCHCCRSSPTPKKKTVFFRPSTFFLTQQTLQLTPPSCPSPALFRT